MSLILDAERLISNVESSILRDLSENRIGGASVYVEQNGKVLLDACYGYANEQRRMSCDSVFRLASMTKPITAVAVLILLERGLLSLSDPLERYIPEYKDMQIGKLEGQDIRIAGSAKKRVTVQNLLNHSSGIGSMESGDMLFSSAPRSAKQDIASITNYFASCPLAFEPGEKTFYSPLLAFDLLARVIELISGKGFSEFLNNEIFEPLGMKDTTFAPSEEQWDRMVSLYDIKDGKGYFHPIDKAHVFGDLPLTYHCGGAGLASAKSDYVSFAKMLLNKGILNGKRIVSPSFITLMSTPSVSQELMPWGERWGLGVRVIDHGILPKHSFGWSGAYGTHFWVDPDNKIVAIYMKNSIVDGGSGAMTARQFEKAVMSAAL